MNCHWRAMLLIDRLLLSSLLDSTGLHSTRESRISQRKCWQVIFHQSNCFSSHLEPERRRVSPCQVVPIDYFSIYTRPTMINGSFDVEGRRRRRGHFFSLSSALPNNRQAQSPIKFDRLCEDLSSIVPRRQRQREWQAELRPSIFTSVRRTSKQSSPRFAFYSKE